MNLSLVLDMALSGYPDRPAVSGGGTRLTYAELDRLSRGAAASVAADGLDAVLHLAANSPALPVALFAAARAGVPFVPLNYRQPASQLAAIVGGYRRALLVYDRDRPGGGTGPAVPAAGLAAWARKRGGDPRLAPESPDDEETVAVLLYTSGTTAAPKAAVLRHRHLLAYLLGTVEFGGAGEDEAALVCVPPYHVAGVANLVSNLYAGRRVVYLDVFDPATWLDTARAEGVTQAMLVPTMLARLAEYLTQHGGERPADVPTLRSIAYGGARMPLPVLRRALALFPDAGFVNAYGLTETSSTIALLGPDDHRVALTSADPAVQARLGSVGRLLPAIEMQVRADDGTPLPPGETGLLFLRGDQVSGEYVGSSAVDADGWFATRDRGRLDGDGYLFIEGRADDTIIRGGENIAPAEIEDALCAHPAVAEAVVLGLPDEEWGQRIAAVIVPAAGAAPEAEELRAWARGRLRSAKTPDVVVFRAELPRTDTGKVLRRKLADELNG
jgi:acyl-CoA synthetase (AMP-forming)/AMP-acid ligase II